MQRRSPKTRKAPQSRRPDRRRHVQERARKLRKLATALWGGHFCPPRDRSRKRTARRHALPAIFYPAPTGGQECPPHTAASYLNPQQFFEDKSCRHRQDKEQPNPIHTVSCNIDIPIGIVNRN